MTCPKCNTTYTHRATNIPKEAGRQATIVCKCGAHFDVTVRPEKKLSLSWRWPFVSRSLYHVRSR